MSGAGKAVGKIFKKVVKVVKKLAPVILGAAAIYFTAGAALGVAGTAGGWGGAVSGLVGKLGLGSTLSSVLTGGMTQAGYGAVLGGLTSAAAGGDIGKGALTGALTGAATGGLLGGFNQPTDPFKGIGETPSAAAGAGVAAPPGAPSNLGLLTGSEGSDTLVGAHGTDQLQKSTGLLSGVGKFITDNQTLVGSAISGLGAGIGSFAQADADVEAAKILSDQDVQRRAEIAGNFGTGGGGGLLSSVAPDATPRPTPTQQFNPATRLSKTQGQRWRYNPESGQIELT